MSENTGNSPTAPAARPDILDRNIYVWDTSNPKSVINLVPEKMRERMHEALWSRGDLFELDEQDLFKRLRKDGIQPTATDNRVRLKFWVEYDRVHQHGYKSMVIDQIVSNVCSREYFDKFYLRRAEKVAWLLCPPVDYATKATEALAFGLEQMREVLEMNHWMANGKIDYKLLEAKIKVFKMLDDRLQGQAVQRIEERSVQVKLASTQSVSHLIEQMRETAMNKEFANIEAREKWDKTLGNQEGSSLVEPALIDVTKGEDESTPVS